MASSFGSCAWLHAAPIEILSVFVTLHSLPSVCLCLRVRHASFAYVHLLVFTCVCLHCLCTLRTAFHAPPCAGLYVSLLVRLTRAQATPFPFATVLHAVMLCYCCVGLNVVGWWLPNNLLAYVGVEVTCRCVVNKFHGRVCLGNVLRMRAQVLLVSPGGMFSVHAEVLVSALSHKVRLMRVVSEV